MRTLSSLIFSFVQVASTLLMLLVDMLHFLRLCLRFPTALAAENLFLRKQLALYQERQVKPQHATHAIRIALTWLTCWSDWRQASDMTSDVKRREQLFLRLHPVVPCIHWKSRSQ